MTLNISSFFGNYINHPLSGDLTVKEKIKASVASAALGILTLGFAQSQCAKWHAKHVKQKFGEDASAARALAALQMPSVYTTDQEQLSRSPPAGTLRFDTVGASIQSALMEPYYKRPLPPAEQVIVTHPDTGKKVPWKTLTPEQKIRVNNAHTHPHNQVPHTMAGRLLIDRFFMPGGQECFLPGDPRESHGCDHAARVALFTPIFAYLYAKYHPSYDHITPNHILLSQFIAAGHDAARQTEGADVYDAESALATTEALKSVGVTDEEVLREAELAIREKDHKVLSKKPLLSKLGSVPKRFN